MYLQTCWQDVASYINKNDLAAYIQLHSFEIVISGSISCQSNDEPYLDLTVKDHSRGGFLECIKPKAQIVNYSGTMAYLRIEMSFQHGLLHCLKYKTCSISHEEL